MDIYGQTIVNLIGLAALFWYQHYRMKLLSESLERQRSLLEETKNVVSQQATAISSQSTVVDAAVKYSQAFSPDRIEQMVRKELELEYRGEKKELEEKINALSQRPDIPTDAVSKVAERAVKKVADMFLPVVTRYSIHLLMLPDSERTKELDQIDVPEIRELLVGIVAKGQELIKTMKLENPNNVDNNPA